MVVGEEQGSNIREPPILSALINNTERLKLFYRRKKTASFDTVFLIVVGEEQDSNIREPPTLWDLINNTELLSFSIDEKKPYLSIRFF
ncbi:hypothetical protein C0W38_15075 [Photobacterium angustum]|nr:hypothetical protein UA39_18340 [Photobacterium angustum]KJG27890.1 hypothetical protein UA36_18915 [Photobacterium angustum]PSW94349.1 hypothetical protein C0W79_13705 [Photobacterium angustum]PSX03092.1 hypothetical protein C0W87_05720 [Photobacterium angustum]PSX34428.1 hypothetical protein C0W38_15075 [Photobacterium angustum]